MSDGVKSLGVLSDLMAKGGLVSESEEETLALGADLARFLVEGQPGESTQPSQNSSPLVCLQGEMGAGKTVLVAGIATAVGVTQDQVQSPTFTLINEYADAAGAVRITHCDLYRLETEEIDSTGLFELMDQPGRITVVEWSERLGRNLPGTVTLRLSRLAGQEASTSRRRIEVVPPLGPLSSLKDS